MGPSIADSTSPEPGSFAAKSSGGVRRSRFPSSAQVDGTTISKPLAGFDTVVQRGPRETERPVPGSAPAGRFVDRASGPVDDDSAPLREPVTVAVAGSYTRQVAACRPVVHAIASGRTTA